MNRLVACFGSNSIVLRLGKVLVRSGSRGDLLRDRNQASQREGIIVDGRKSAEEQAADVGEDRSATGRDATLRQQGIQLAEGMVDALGALKIAGVAQESHGEVLSGLMSRDGGMTLAERRARLG
jgi:hypothetical protein